MHATALRDYRVEAFNTSKASENRIHDDAVARRFGFTGGLVPGVDVYAYMTHAPVARWGRAWLEHGSAECRFARPVYDGEIATVAADGTAELALRVESQGNLCATGTAALPPPPAPIDLAAWQVPPPPPATRPPASTHSLAEGLWLGVRPLHVTPEFAANYCADVRETDPIYRQSGLMHPGLILRVGNWVLGHNTVLGPWIHVGSRVQHHAAGRVGDTLSARARVTANHEHKGHAFVELDVLVIANDRLPLARIAHTAIWRPRQVAEA